MLSNEAFSYNARNERLLVINNMHQQSTNRRRFEQFPAVVYYITILDMQLNILKSHTITLHNRYESDMYEYRSDTYKPISMYESYIMAKKLLHVLDNTSYKNSPSLFDIEKVVTNLEKDHAVISSTYKASVITYNKQQYIDYTHHNVPTLLDTLQYVDSTLHNIAIDKDHLNDIRIADNNNLFVASDSKNFAYYYALIISTKRIIEDADEITEEGPNEIIQEIPGEIIQEEKVVTISETNNRNKTVDFQEDAPKEQLNINNQPVINHHISTGEDNKSDNQNKNILYHNNQRFYEECALFYHTNNQSVCHDPIDEVYEIFRKPIQRCSSNKDINIKDVIEVVRTRGYSINGGVYPLLRGGSDFNTKKFKFVLPGSSSNFIVYIDTTKLPEKCKSQDYLNAEPIYKTLTRWVIELRSIFRFHDPGDECAEFFSLFLENLHNDKYINSEQDILFFAKEVQEINRLIEIPLNMIAYTISTFIVIDSWQSGTGVRIPLRLLKRFIVEVNNSIGEFIGTLWSSKDEIKIPIYCPTGSKGHECHTSNAAADILRNAIWAGIDSVLSLDSVLRLKILDIATHNESGYTAELTAKILLICVIFMMGVTFSLVQQIAPKNKYLTVNKNYLDSMMKENFNKYFTEDMKKFNAATQEYIKEFYHNNIIITYGEDKCTNGYRLGLSEDMLIQREDVIYPEPMNICIKDDLQLEDYDRDIILKATDPFYGIGIANWHWWGRYLV